MIVVWSAKARTELAFITDYITTDSPYTAQKFIPQIIASIETLKDHPTIGRSGRVSNTRELIVHKSYIVVYNISGGSINILSIRHTARLWPQNF